MRSIVIGLGETGQPLYEILKGAYPETYGYDKGHGDCLTKCDFDILNICIPYSKDFIEIVTRYADFFNPEITIIHSTVPIGTTSQIPNAVHSPIRGQHSRMKSDLQNYVKWVGGELSDFASEYLRDAGFKVMAVATSEQTEAMKLLCLAKYGKDIAFAFYCADIAKHYSFDFGYADILEWDGEYNQHVEERLKRPIISVGDERVIGGHCVVQNTKILNEQHPNPMLTEILKYEKGDKNYKAWGICNIYPSAVIGDGTNIGWFSEIGNNVKIGSNCRIGAFAYIPEGVTIEDNCFIAPKCTFTNDKYPPSGKKDWLPTLVKRGARIGAGSTIICGVTIGENTLVGAGSVVTKDIPDYEVWAGVPATFMRGKNGN